MPTEWLRSASERVELAIVLAIAFGWFVCVSTLAAIEPGSDVVVTDARLLSIVGYEIMAGGLALLVLHVRGKKISHYGSKLSLRLTLMGIGLCVGVIALYWGFYVGSWYLAGLEGFPVTTQESVTLLPVLALVVVNPAFEEFFAGGYLIATLERRSGAVVAIAASTALRIGYHTYQGLPGVIGSLCLGVLFGWAYLRNRQLWPLIVAHALLDGLGLLAS